MSSPLDQPNQTDTRQSDDRKHSPPAFLDLADSSARLGTNMPELSARVELKRMGHERQRIELERQRLLQRKAFEDQMHPLEYQQQRENQELLSIPVDGNAGNSLPRYASAPATPPPRADSALGGGLSPHYMDASLLSAAVGKAEKRKSVTYAPVSSDYEAPVPMGLSGTMTPLSNRPISYRSTGFANSKSMPASRRTSRSSQDEELAEHLQGLSVVDNGYESPLSSGPPSIGIFNGKHSMENDGVHFVANGNGNGYSAGMLLDQQLEKEMNNAINHLPSADDEKYTMNMNQLSSKLSTSSAALDLAPLSQTPPRGSFIRMPDSREKASEWPQFSAPNRVSERSDGPRRTVTTPQIGVQSVLSATATPFAQQTPVTSRRSSPLGIQTSNLRPDVLMKKGPLTPQSAEAHNMGRLSGQRRESSVSPSDASGPYSRRSPSQYESPVGFNGATLDDAMQAQFDYLNGQNSNYGLESGHGTPAGSTAGSTALYQHGGRYGIGASGRFNGHDHKANGYTGPKHRRHDADPAAANRFANTRLEELQGQIAHLCKDQHGCRYLQKKLEEGQAEHRDMIFRETFGHFAELMIDPFGNYLCQKLLEFSTDEQRNMICESVAQDLVSISLNMHGTRAVQKMIDFLTTQRQGRKQADLRCNVQIHSIIVALSLHVVVLIKDLNGNHVIQKCLNKLAPEDNQFIYNAVAANCVEVATHRHGCCVLQRCVDHASETQRVQLVNEITFNALTLVQDPYGNYVVQYILDLNDNRFSDAVIRQFTGNVCALSVQKFSSNVIEKCIRVAGHDTRKMLIEELLNRTRLEKLLRDSFGNYCVQTALDYADPAQRAMLVEGIRPILPLIRNTPYGKRIQSKLQREQMDFAHTNSGNQYGGNGYANQPHSQQFLNMGLANQSLNPGHGHGHHHGISRHVSQPNLRQANQFNEMYDARSMYALQQQQNGGRMHGQHQMHGQQMHHGMQTQGIDSYVLQQNAQHGMAAANGYNNVGGFANGMPVPSFGNTMPLNGATNDPYQQHTAYAYGM